MAEKAILSNFREIEARKEIFWQIVVEYVIESALAMLKNGTVQSRVGPRDLVWGLAKRWRVDASPIKPTDLHIHNVKKKSKFACNAISPRIVPKMNSGPRKV